MAERGVKVRVKTLDTAGTREGLLHHWAGVRHEIQREGDTRYQGGRVRSR